MVHIVPPAKTKYHFLNNAGSQDVAVESSDSLVLRGVDVVADDDVKLIERTSKTFSEEDVDDLELQEIKDHDRDNSELIASAWSPTLRKHFVIGMVCLVVVSGLEGAMAGTYVNYALSGLNKLSEEGTLDVAGQVISVVVKLPFAKASDVLGRAEAFSFAASLYFVASTILSLAPGFNLFALGTAIRTFGAGGTHVLTFVLIADFTTARTRGMAANAIFLPSLLTPALSGVLSDTIIKTIGWRAGYFINAILYPAGATFLCITLFRKQAEARRLGAIIKEKISFRDFASQVDLGGLSLLTLGLALTLVPITLSTKAEGHFKTGWVPALFVLGFALLACGWQWEKRVATHPAVPSSYFKLGAVAATLSVAILDAVGYSVTHTYLFPWSVAAHDLSPRTATYLQHASGVGQILFGLLTGYLMHRLRRYKILTVAGTIVRVVGYGLMTRLRTNDSTLLELFIVQIIQGAGTGIIETTMIVASQIVVPQEDVARITAMIAMSFHLGGGVGSAIAGGIYTATFKDRLRVRMGPGTAESQIESIYDSITGTLPEWGSVQRIAVNAAYSDVIGYMTWWALATCLPVIFIMAYIMPNNKLSDSKGLPEEDEAKKDVDLDELPMQRAKITE